VSPPGFVLESGVVGAAVRIQVRAVEESYLARVHGETPTAYAASPGRFLSKLRQGFGRR
jgi:hypothetical protein